MGAQVRKEQRCYAAGFENGGRGHEQPQEARRGKEGIPPYCLQKEYSFVNTLILCLTSRSVRREICVIVCLWSWIVFAMMISGQQTQVETRMLNNQLGDFLYTSATQLFIF